MTRQPRHGSAGLELLLDEELLEDTHLSRVLSAARQPTHPEELTGLAAARAAFVATYNPAPVARGATAQVPAGRRPARTRTFAGRLVALKAAAVVSGATLAGGAAFAAAQTDLLGTGTHHSHRPTSQAASPPVAPGGAYLTSAAGSHGRATPAHGSPAGHPAPAPAGGKSVGNGHSHAPHSATAHPTHTPPPTPPGQSNPPHRKKARKTHPVHPSKTAAATPKPVNSSAAPGA